MEDNNVPEVRSTRIDHFWLQNWGKLNVLSTHMVDDMDEDNNGRISATEWEDYKTETEEVKVG